MSCLFSLYQSPSSLRMVFNIQSSKIDKVLLINTSTNIFVIGHFNIHHKDWLICSDGTENGGKPYSGGQLSYSNPWFSLLDFFHPSDPNIFSTVAFPPLWNSDYAVVSNLLLYFRLKKRWPFSFYSLWLFWYGLRLSLWSFERCSVRGYL